MLIVRVKNESAFRAVHEYSKGSLEGHKVYVQRSEGSKKPKTPSDPAVGELEEQLKEWKGPARSPAIQVPEDRDTNVWRASVVDCDLVRDYLEMSPELRRSRGGRTVDPCRLILRKVQGAGGGHSYVYTKHRGECPIRLGRVDQPSWADHYIGWIFQKGFQPAMRGGIFWPSELRASDKLWTRQATEDLMTRLPYIREGAEWVQTPTERPGLGWSWKAPTTAIPTTTPTPTGKGIP